MDNNLSEHDPYRGMKRAQDDIRPEFSPLKNSPEANKAEENNSGKRDLKAAEKAAADKDVEKADQGGVNAAKKSESSPAGLFSGTGRNILKKKSGIPFLGKKSAGSFIGILVAMLAVGTMMVGTPIFMIGALDYNLQKSLGFSGTVAILEKIAEHITGEKITKGNVPKNYAEDLANAGITVGQVTANGDFVKTNVYIADLDERKDIAAVGSGFQTTTQDGELAVLYDNEIIKGEDFVAAVESDPKMYAAFSEAANISAKFYYSSEVNDIYNEMGITRHAFHNFEITGDEEKDMENYNKILEEVLDKQSDLSVNGFSEEEDSFTTTIKGDAEAVVQDIADQAHGLDPTKKASQLLNSAISANEPYRAAAAFMAIEEPIQRARIEGDGPVNEVMNTLNEVSDATYIDVNTGQEVTTTASIIDTPNFAAAASEGTFSKSEAANFARDRVLKSTGGASDGIIKDTAVDQDGQKKSDSVIDMGIGVTAADKSVLDKAVDNIEIAVSEKNSDLFRSVIGGNRAVEGGSFISNSINMQTLGALPSDQTTVLAYSHEVNEAIARKEAADRATKSPFDISSPNTFLGSIAHSFASSMLRNRRSVLFSSAVSTLGSVASVTNDSLAGLFGGAVADGEDESYLTTFGDECVTASGVTSSADIYCTQHTTIVTKYIEKDGDYWDSEVDSDSYEKEFVLPAMDRKTTVGVKDASVCEKAAEDKSVIDSLAGIFGLYDACNEVDAGVANGAAYVLSDSNSDKSKMEKYAGKALYDEASSLLEESETPAYLIKKDYYAKHPKDNSPAGILARRSGLSRWEAEIALNYYSYLARIKNYDPTTRFAFGEDLVIKEESPLKGHSDKIALNYYAVKRGGIEYDSIRNRSFAA